MVASKEVIASTKIAGLAALDKLATEVIAIDLSEQLVLSEVFLIVTGANSPQVGAIADEVERKMTEAGQKPLRRENGP